MNRLLIDVNNLVQVLQYYDQLKVYRADTVAGTYTEISSVYTRVALIPEKTQYYFTDDAGLSTHYYKVTYYNSVSAIESDITKSTPLQGGASLDKVGYTFGNYSAPPGEWGAVLTPDDIRYTYMWGVDTIANDANDSEFTDEQFAYFIDAAVSDFESFLTIDIKKRVYKTNPADTDVQSVDWREGVDYTNEENEYPFIPEHWRDFGFLQLRHWPILSVERWKMYSPVKGEILDLLTWARINKKTGQLTAYPKNGTQYGPYSIYGMPWALSGRQYPGGFEVDYTTGYKSSDFVPKDMRGVIGMWATLKALDTIGDGLLAGFSSQSVSLDGLSESFSSTQSATSATFGARIKSYADQIDSWMKKNRYKHGAIPISFVGVS